MPDPERPLANERRELAARAASAITKTPENKRALVQACTQMRASREKEDWHGFTNSRANSTAAVSGVGVDTVSVAYRTWEPKVWERIAEISAAGEIVLSPPSWPQGEDPEPEERLGISEAAFGATKIAEPIRSAQWRIYPQHRMLYWEGRLSAVAADDAGDHSLADPAELPQAAGEASRKLEQIAALPEGCLAKAEHGVRRLDLAADLSFEKRSEGLAFLRTLAALSVPRRKVQTWAQAGGRLETVSFHKLAGGLVLRAYDKGAERKATGAEDAEPPGRRIRIERQHRWQRKDQPTPEEVAFADHGKMWLAGFERWLDAAERVTVASADDQEEAIIAAVEQGSISVADAERLLAGAAIVRSRGGQWWADRGKPDTGRRRMAAAAKAGLLLDPRGDGKNPANVAIAPTIRALRDAWK